MTVADDLLPCEPVAWRYRMMTNGPPMMDWCYAGSDPQISHPLWLVEPLFSTPQPDAVRGRSCALQASPSVPSRGADSLSDELLTCAKIAEVHCRNALVLLQIGGDSELVRKAQRQYDFVKEAIRSSTTPSPTPARDGGNEHD